MLISFLFLLLAGVGGAPSATCTIVQRPWVRGDSVMYVVATAEADSAPAARWSPPDFRLPRAGAPPPPPPPPPPPRSPQTVYGQWARVERSSGAAVGPRALLIFWGLGSACNAEPRAGSASALPPGTRFLLEGRPRPDSLAPAGVPTFDVTAGARLYAPAQERRQARRTWRTLWRAPRVLGIAEYEELYRALPAWTAWEADPARAAEPLRAWARRRPHLARQAPARQILEGMQRELERELERRRRPPRPGA